MKIDELTLKNYILQEGWTDYGILPIHEVQKALQYHEGVFEKWIEAGYQGEMNYLKQMQPDRFHPKNKLPEVRSVIVLIAWYSHPPTPPSSRGEGGVVARYARGRDYHKILKKKLIRLSDWLRKKDDRILTYASVDSGPTVDRVLAQTASLGFFGKNANLIDPRRGSYFFIASLMTNLELTPTPKEHMPNCGDCRRCMVACPTDAIVAPGVIDARRCISYLTIENKGGIPMELRSKLGNRLFGCDICQEVCPFNIGRAGKQEVKMEALKSVHGAGECLNLKEVLSIKTDEEFLEKFAGTPLMRAKRRGLLRNACVVAGNSGDKTLIPYLEKVKELSDEMLNEHAQWAMDQLS